jgi:3-hydroxybutyryl-CoA dehydrogenase
VAAIATATKRPDWVLGMHFFNPVHIMKLVELVRHDQTGDEVVETAREVTVRMGKVPIVVRDCPGFASSRLGVVLGLEAMRMLEQHVASAEDIDKAMTLGYGHPMGPLRVSDLVGLDVRLAIAEYLHGELGDAHFEPPAILVKKVREGELGKKTRHYYDQSSRQTQRAKHPNPPAVGHHAERIAEQLGRPRGDPHGSRRKSVRGRSRHRRVRGPNRHRPV